MTPETRDALNTIRAVINHDLDAIAAFVALKQTLLGEAEVRRNHLALIGQLKSIVRAILEADERGQGVLYAEAMDAARKAVT
jgi:hypothetical protein